RRIVRRPAARAAGTGRGGEVIRREPEDTHSGRAGYPAGGSRRSLGQPGMSSRRDSLKAHPTPGGYRSERRVGLSSPTDPSPPPSGRVPGRGFTGEGKIRVSGRGDRRWDIHDGRKG